MLTADEGTEWRAEEWSLCGEGGRNIALRDGAGRVLRLLKRFPARSESGVHAQLERALWAHLAGFACASLVERSWLFAKHVLVPLLGAHACAGQLVRLPAGFAHALEARLSCRLAVEAGLDGCCLALLLPDHAALPVARAGPSPCWPVFAVELKPKCGFLPSAPAVQAGSVKLRTSRFALHQQLKLAQGRVRELSAYCPLNLFSGDAQRMAAALRALLATPQNNLCILRDGLPVFGGAGRPADPQPPADAAALADALRGLVPAHVPPQARSELLVALLVRVLAATGVLRHLLAVQQLDSADVEGAYQAFCRLVDGLEEGTLPCQAALALLRDFLTAHTAKDCAIMVTLQQLPADAEGEGVVCDPHTGLCCRFRVAFLDLDLKLAAKMPDYVVLDRQVVEAAGTRHASSDL